MSAAAFSAVYFDGRFVPSGTLPTVPVTDRGLLLGEGVFETLRGYDGVCFRAQRHFETLVRGAAAFGLVLPVSIPRLVAIADEAAVRTKASAAYVRVTLTRGTGGDDAAPSVLTVLSRPLVVPSDDDYASGVPATFVTPRRIPPACMDPTVKTTSYAPQVLARREAVARGVGEGEGIMLAIDGTIACGTMANLFLVTGSTLRTPPVESGCRAGITRGAVLELAAQVGLTVRVEPITRESLFEAEEAFFTSSRVECLPIATIDGEMVGGTIRAGERQYRWTTALRGALRSMVVAENGYESPSDRYGTA